MAISVAAVVTSTPGIEAGEPLAALFGQDLAGAAAAAEVADQGGVDLGARACAAAHQLRAPRDLSAQDPRRFVADPDAGQHPPGQQLGDHPCVQGSRF